MVRGLLIGVSAAIGFIAQAAGQVTTGQTVLTIDAANSQIVIQVGKTGMFGFAGHAHEVVAASVRGQVRFDPADLGHASVSLECASAALRVTGQNEPPADVPEVQRIMLSERVLDVARFRAIAFSSRRVSVSALTAGGAEAVIEGDMTVHGTTRPMTIQARVTLDAAGRITARGTFTLKQTDFGMVPVTAAGGSIRVKDELEIQFVLRARPSDVTRISQ